MKPRQPLLRRPDLTLASHEALLEQKSYSVCHIRKQYARLLYRFSFVLSTNRINNKCSTMLFHHGRRNNGRYDDPPLTRWLVVVNSTANCNSANIVDCVRIFKETFTIDGGFLIDVGEHTGIAVPTKLSN
jgi:hypothetical protein